MNYRNLTPVRSYQELSRGAPVSAGRHQTPGPLRTACLCIASALSLSVVSVWATPIPASGQQPSGSYTNAQAEAGATVYQATCSECHLTDFQGSFEAPELAGPNFRNTWGGRRVGDLLVLIGATMPPQAAGSLNAEQVASVLAYILRANDVQADGTELSLASTGTVIPGAERVAVTDVAGVPPIPGRVGTIRSPDTRQAPPEFLGAISETPTSITETYRAPARFTPVSERRIGLASRWRLGCIGEALPGRPVSAGCRRSIRRTFTGCSLRGSGDCPMEAVTGPRLSRDRAFSS